METSRTITVNTSMQMIAALLEGRDYGISTPGMEIQILSPFSNKCDAETMKSIIVGLDKDTVVKYSMTKPEIDNLIERSNPDDLFDFDVLAAWAKKHRGEIFGYEI